MRLLAVSVIVVPCCRLFFEYVYPSLEEKRREEKRREEKRSKMPRSCFRKICVLAGKYLHNFLTSLLCTIYHTFYFNFF